jgi:uroporphyrinogen decarboxylase
MVDQMNKWERIRAAVKGRPTDRTCVALWRHFPVDDMTPEGLAKVSLEFQAKFDWDLVKFTPTGTYGVMDWGAETVWKPNDMGVRTIVKFGVNKPEEWLSLPKLDPTKGFYGQQNQALSLVARELNGQAPLLQTIFSPLTTARKLAGDRIFTDLRTNPAAFKAGMETITEVTIQFALEAVKAGATGMFFATQNGSYRVLNESEYIEWGAEYDLRVLNTLRSKVEFLLVHIHGEDTMYDLLTKYPVDMANWHDRITAPTLSEGRRRFPGMVVGGINEWNTLVTGSVADIEAEVQDAIAQTDGGKGLMIAPGCVVPGHAPEEHLMVVRKAVEK